MNVFDIVSRLGFDVISGETGLSREITGGYSSDLLSDVMGNAQEGQAWVTLQTHKNVLAIASLKDLACVIIINNHKPDEDTIAKSNEEGIPMLSTNMSAFETVGKLFELLK